VKQEVNGTVILPALVFPAVTNTLAYYSKAKLPAVTGFIKQARAKRLQHD